MRKVLQASVVVLACFSCHKKESSIKDVAASAPTREKFDIIDHSFLFPFPDVHGVALSASGNGVNGVTQVIFPLEQFKRLPPEFLRHTGRVGSPVQTLANGEKNPEFDPNFDANVKEMHNRLYITGFRYDPCFPIVTKMDPNAPGCRARAIRLVGQFIDFTDGAASSASMHILFILKHPDPAIDVIVNNKMLDGLAALKKLASEGRAGTAGVPLGVHPGFLGENKAKFSQAVTDLILSLVSPKNFFATSVFFKDLNQPVWHWGQFLNREVSPELKQLTLEITTGVKVGANTLDFGNFALDSSGAGVMMPGDNELRDVAVENNPLFFPLPHISGLLAADEGTPNIPDLTKGIMAADVYENPTMMTIPAGDCASCHLATQRRISAENRLASANQLDQVSRKARFESDKSMDPKILEYMTKTKLTLDPASQILLNFGYHGKQPVISQRTVNEATQVTKLINATMLTPVWTAM